MFLSLFYSGLHTGDVPPFPSLLAHFEATEILTAVQALCSLPEEGAIQELEDHKPQPAFQPNTRYPPRELPAATEVDAPPAVTYKSDNPGMNVLVSFRFGDIDYCFLYW